MRNFAFKTRNCVSKTRIFCIMMNFAAGAVTRSMHGEMSVFRIWNSIGNSGIDQCPAAQTAGLIVQYVFGESGDTVHDTSGNEKNGAIHNADWSDDVPPSQQCQVSFQRKNPDFLLKNPDFLLKNSDFLLRNPGFLLKNPDFLLQKVDSIIKHRLACSRLVTHRRARVYSLW